MGKSLGAPDDANDQGSIVTALSALDGNATGNCSKNCSGHGSCSRGKCLCDTPWSGRACDVKVTCPNNCGGHGRCTATGKCVCTAGWEGRDCMSAACPNNCNARGICVAGTCQCKQGFDGESCEVSYRPRTYE